MQYDQRLPLPEPDAASRRHSEGVAAGIRAEIEAAGGSISFAEFMQHALYAPGLGYYAAGATKFGEAGDFVTAPEVSPLFGRVLALQCAEVLAATGDGAILEVGAGSGRLAATLLGRLADVDALPERYEILEVSPDLCQRQRQYLQSEVPELAARVSWIERPPRDFRGVIIANEVLDALPVERFRRTSEGVRQQRVRLCDGGFALFDACAPDPLAAAVDAIENSIGAALPAGYVSEISLGLPGWVGDICGALERGLAFLFDYGVARREYYAAQRSGGWLRCHFRHRAHDDPFIRVGIQDITAWVDFTAVAEAAVTIGLDVAGYAAQAQFLLGGGLEQEFRRLSEMSTVTQLETARQAKMLTLPGEMGEHFKCMALRRGDVPVPSAFGLADRTHTL